MTLAQYVDAIVLDAIERCIFPGAVVLIAQGGQILHRAAYGSTMYNGAEARPVRPNTIYDVASLTKMFTATAALRLSDAGKLDLGGPVAAYLPGFRWPDVTAWHLLTHTSGLDIRLSSLRHAGRAGILAAAYQATLNHAPGTHVAYTNVNSLLLGEIVARLHDTPLDQAVSELVIGPLGLRDTSFCPPTELLARIAPTELDQEWRGGLVHGSVHDESAHALGGVAGHAGLFSTAGDLYAFCSAWLDSLDQEKRRQAGEEISRLSPNLSVCLSPLLHLDTAVLAITNHTAGLNAACGLGWMIDRPNFMGAAPGGTFGHTGFTGPAIAVVPSLRLVLVILNNRVFPRRGLPTHHDVTAAILDAAVAWAANTH
jgi:serine-type D-Ala-D-Ala carboxypeptidase